MASDHIVFYIFGSVFRADLLGNEFLSAINLIKFKMVTTVKYTPSFIRFIRYCHLHSKISGALYSLGLDSNNATCDPNREDTVLKILSFTIHPLK